MASIYKLVRFRILRFFTIKCFFPKFSRNQKEMSSRRRCYVGCLYGQVAQCWNL
ncbi:DNA-directed RNA polymerase subunit beta [Gossypium arboreum]|uniref:DNA-directed RNA polymerase subunit beta n=1 Tax=Gossypium arboreum TaxID=29729 RepID=A0A0B0MIY6_GOSAR|nr:DNA-directed RNA polymerase subunit beta [Gossypium arboreum]KHG06242.1 DNA-directed RNA polymerase subunit beta [Gossypium arboreum]